jgi:hypothetical protein
VENYSTGYSNCPSDDRCDRNPPPSVAHSARKRKFIERQHQSKSKSKTTPKKASSGDSDWEEGMLKLESAKWAQEKDNASLDFKFQKLKRYKELEDLNYSDADIRVLVSELGPIIDQLHGGNEADGGNHDSGNNSDGDRDSGSDNDRDSDSHSN